ncbi:MAG: trigger factor [Alphaproteobacteria bacterium]|nr:trigger factor [Alphaproteobacteria bacterium]
MLPTKDKVKGLKHELFFEVPAPEYERALSSELAEFQKTYETKGFRKGCVPLNVIKQKYPGAFENEVITRLVNESVREYCDAKKLTPAIRPNVDVEDMKEGQPVKFTVVLEVLPTIKPVELEKLSIDRPTAKPSDKDIDEAIKNIATSRASSEKITEDRKTKKGDVAVIDFEGFVDGVAFEGGKGENHPLELGSNQFIPGFEDQVIGHKAGSSIEVNVPFPKDYGHAALAGKKALFKVKINEIRERKIPAINDEFAKELKRENLADLKKYVGELLAQNYVQTSTALARARMLDALAKEKVELPEGLVDREVDYMWQNANARRDVSKLTEKEIEKEKKPLYDDAERRVKLGLLLAEIGKLNSISASDEEVQQAIFQEAMRHGQQMMQVVEYYKKNKDAAEMIRAGIFEDKTLDFIISKAKVKEREMKPDELMKLARELK